MKQSKVQFSLRRASELLNFGTRVQVWAASVVYTGLVATLLWYIDSTYVSLWSPYTVSVPSHSILLYIFMLATVPSLWIPLSFQRPSQVVYWFIYLVSYIPIIIVTPLVLEQIPFAFLTVAFITMIILRQAFYLPRISIRNRLSWGGYWPSLVTSWSGIVGMLGIVFSQRLQFGSDMYAARAAFRAELVSFGPILYRVLFYGMNYLENVLVPLFIAASLSGYIGPIGIVFGVSASLLVWTIGAFKSAFFAVVIAIALWMALHDNGHYLPTYVLGGGIITVSVPLVGHFLLDDYTDVFLEIIPIVRRFILNSGIITAYYVEFIQTHSYTGFAGRSYIPGSYPYSAPISEVIGTAYFGQSIHANAPFWGHSFAGAGLVGMIGAALLFMIALWMLDCAAVGLDARFSGAVIAGQLTGLAYTSILSNLTMGGFLFLVLLLIFMPRKSDTSMTWDLIERTNVNDFAK